MDNSDKIILDLCGGTGAFSQPYADAGYDVRVITLPGYDVTKTIILDDHLYFTGGNKEGMRVFCKDVYGILAAPPCTMFSRARTRATKPRDLKEGMVLVRACMQIVWHVQESATDERGLPLLKFWALENPMGSLRKFLGRPRFSFNPCDYGDA